MQPFAGAVDEDVVLKDNSAHPNCAAIVNDYLASASIQRMHWSTLSPDVNPIEHARDGVPRCLSARKEHPKTVRQLAMGLEDDWSRIPLQEIRNLIQRFPRQCWPVFGDDGGHTL